jgi:hypothetical protein
MHPNQVLAAVCCCAASRLHTQYSPGHRLTPASASHKECTHVRQSQRAPRPIAFEILSVTTMHSFIRQAAEPLWTPRCCATQPKLCLGVHEHMHVSRVKVSDLLCCRLLSPLLHLTTHDAGSTCAVNKPVLQQGRATALVSSKRSSQLPSPRCLCDPDAAANMQRGQVNQKPFS